MEKQARQSETTGSSLYAVWLGLLFKRKLSQSWCYRLGLPYAKLGIAANNHPQRGWGLGVLLRCLGNVDVVCTIHTDVQQAKGFPGLLNCKKLRWPG
ncbi:hypothetical protein EUGRSUZ_E02173 [Eucalyptus grandis]|uniref:Uncharacterized protein n=2 Tax=Eucalyptus grandis TaxID=71139 RepID=A0ACC3KX47_EUCGR|nr:hypothetical protein EUGRSUZ_E02173 [Eucalyptus grandis]